ncbi:hypothetical protein SAMN05443572_10460 [Myxococcus fulvus]|uniref:Uncharacterized protein n=1 Tax=Myxococcus fulvus TaxID=33 RepID=A0A511SZJ0_MYXFU|nr:hypothetical protein [Myxococcus fulvus]AKF83626.1 hypothetical protein MFUL124B02_36775 [Myxococcus fulvus 124B02]GEN07319.1 hypothetical protein MFU01_23560 [Myxococcus fulvus]SET95725.1 hypothetical protein SAMN05443572_10460 [Myxococcus fulvus]
MNRKLYVLGAVLGTVPGLLPGACPPGEMPAAEARREAQAPVSAHGKGRTERRAVVAPPEAPKAVRSEDARAIGARETEAPRHPCELMTVVKVPCDERLETCEYTYWECPAAVNPLRA